MARQFFVFLTMLSTYISVNTIAFASEKKDIASYYQKFDNDFDDEDDFESYESLNNTEISDPLEKYNRKIFAFNDAFDRYFLEHVAKEYRKLLPKPVRNVVRNFLTNLSLPVCTINSLLQGKGNNSLASFSHFLINTTIGIGGLFDIAGHKGIIYQQEDFGQTLGHYGVKSGPYIIIPFLGPSSGRDIGGLVLDSAISPTQLNILQFGGESDLIKQDHRLVIAGMSGIDKRESLIDVIDDVRKDSFDLYATLRSAYIQKRQSDIER